MGRGGEVLLGGEPFRLLRLSPDGARALDELVGGATRAGPAAEGLGRHLVDGGLLHPVPVVRAVAPHEVDVVVPVRDESARAARLLAQLRADFAGRVVLVDDGSVGEEAERIAAVASAADALLVRRPEAGGPARARNAARPFLAARLVAFVDADVVPEAGWLEPLIGHFDDARLGAVAPRVGAAGTGPLAAYESVSSALDLGAEPGTVGAHRRISYVPSAALVCRRAALEELGWFDPALARGEDVDLVRRLEKAGWVARYEPRSRVRHDSRPDVASFVSQRFGYGTSAAALERRHPGTVAPFEGSSWAVAGVLLTGALSRRRLACLLVFLVVTALPARSLRSKLERVGALRPWRDALTAVLRAEAWTAAGLSTALRRVWWPPALATAAAVPRLRRPVGCALLASELGARASMWWRARRTPVSAPALPGVVATLGYGVLEDLAYGAGVWAGCLRHRSLRAVLPRLAPPTFGTSQVPVAGAGRR